MVGRSSNVCEHVDEMLPPNPSLSFSVQLIYLGLFHAAL